LRTSWKNDSRKLEQRAGQRKVSAAHPGQDAASLLAVNDKWLDEFEVQPVVLIDGRSPRHGGGFPVREHAAVDVVLDNSVVGDGVGACVGEARGAD
jgi:hypothetical protein